MVIALAELWVTAIANWC